VSSTIIAFGIGAIVLMVVIEIIVAAVQQREEEIFEAVLIGLLAMAAFACILIAAGLF
jgi:hypothetical protein